MSGVEILGTREEILASVYAALQGINTTNGYANNATSVQRQYVGIREYQGFDLAVESGSRTTNVPILQDLYRKAFTFNIVGVVVDKEFVGADRSIVTTTESCIRDVELAIKSNPYCSIDSVPKAYQVVITSVDTNYIPPTAAFVIGVSVLFLDTR